MGIEDEGIPPNNLGDEDNRFFTEMRSGAVPIDEAGPSNFTEIVPLSDDHVIESSADKRWNPSSDEAMGFPLMKACIKDDINGEFEFTTQIGRIYWRGDPAEAGEGSPGFPIVGIETCDPCKGETIGDNCFAPYDHLH